VDPFVKRVFSVRLRPEQGLASSGRLTFLRIVYSSQYRQFIDPFNRAVPA
jgi:hypothetical protein